jgi:hypothetical protein
MLKQIPRKRLLKIGLIAAFVIVILAVVIGILVWKLKYSSPQQVYIRTNMFGYQVDDAKIAVVMAVNGLASSMYFTVESNGAVAFRSSMVSGPGWNSKFDNTYQLDFSSVKQEGMTINTIFSSIKIGTYTINVYDSKDNQISKSNPFQIANSPNYLQLFENSIKYFQAQRDGPNISMLN